MLEINGIPPKLSGRECEELICQQYWYQDKLASEVDVLCIKSNERWYLLYFENGTIYWRMQDDEPKPFKAEKDDPFKYPLVDLGEKYGIKDQTIDDCVAESMPNGARVIITFEQAGMIVVSSVDNQTRIQYIKTAY